MKVNLKMKILYLFLILFAFSCSINRNISVQIDRSKRMMYADTSRLGRPFSKDPYVIRFKNKYLMYFSVPGYTDANNKVHGWGIGIAESTDLKTWRKVAEVNEDPAATYEAKGFASPCALVIDGKVNLFYQTYGNGTKDAICHAWSTDGINFIRNTTNPIFRPDGAWNCGRAIDAEVIPFKGKYYLYYATRDPDNKIQMQGVAVAPEKTNFNREDWTNLSKDAPILKPVLPWERDCIEAASVINKNGELFMFYGGSYNNAPQQIGVAKSSDGIHWARLFDQPFLTNGKPGEWNSSESGHPHIFTAADGSTWLFYQGNNDNGKTWYLSNKEVFWKKKLPKLDNPKK
ncbi:MAG: family 43 glycosylhydrolase [Bacteroidota bacterium]|nr:family 43 glycosylhydrolase [Bacteroidota bacterium]